MNVTYYLRGLIYELSLDQRAKKEAKALPYLAELDEAIEAALRLLVETKQEPKLVLGGPVTLLGGVFTKEFEAVWKSRATQTYAMWMKYRTMTSGKERDVARHKLAQRHIRISDNGK